MARRIFCEQGISDHHDDGGETNLANIPHKRPDATAQPACAHVAVRSQRIGEKNIVEEERFEGVKQRRDGSVFDCRYHRRNFGNIYRVDEVVGAGRILDNGFQVPENISPSGNKPGASYTSPFQDKCKACK